MDTLVEGYLNSTNGFDYHPHSIPAVLENGCKISRNLSSPNPEEASPNSDTCSEMDCPEKGDFFDACLKFISQMLMEEEDLEHKPCMFQDCLALQATEKSLSDLLGNNDPPPSPNPLLYYRNSESPDYDFTRTFSSESSNNNSSIDSDWIQSRTEFDSSFGHSSHTEYSSHGSGFQYNSQSFGSSNGFHGAVDGSSMAALVSPFQVPSSASFAVYDLGSQERTPKATIDSERDSSPNGSRGKRNHYLEDSNYAEVGRSNKQLASTYADDESLEESELFDKVLLCEDLNPHLHREAEAEAEAESNKFQQMKQSKSSPVGRRPRGKKKGNQKEVVDLRTLLTQCAQAVSSSDTRTANDLLYRIRQHSSQYGEGTERLAYYFANALEARLAGTGMSLYTSPMTSTNSAAALLKAYQVYVSACPFKKMSFIFANRSIMKLAKNSTTLHIIDFGILYGFQWPCLIQRLSLRSGGPPRLRITGIDFPQTGFRPAERVKDTGRRLGRYCKRFNVPFEYNAIAKKWHTIQLEDLKIDGDEALVVNCLYRLKNVPDDTVSMTSPRDAVLNLIKKIKPDLFIHGIVNGTFNAPFFVTRFREALFHFSAIFDLFDVNAPREDEQRLLYEKEVLAKDVVNVIACEGTERVERPETYKQWQARNLRAGFRPVPLDREILGDVRTKVKAEYHHDFVVDEDSNWMLQGWKGRIIHALSCWKPIEEY